MRRTRVRAERALRSSRGARWSAWPGEHRESRQRERSRRCPWSCLRWLWAVMSAFKLATNNGGADRHGELLFLAEFAKSSKRHTFRAGAFPVDLRLGRS